MPGECFIVCMKRANTKLHVCIFEIDEGGSVTSPWGTGQVLSTVKTLLNMLKTASVNHTAL